MKSIKLKNDYYLDSTSVSHNRKKLSEQIHYHNVTTGQITESGRIVDNKKEYVLKINCGNMPNNTSKNVNLPISLANITITRKVELFGQSSQNEFPIMQTGITWYISGGGNVLVITTTSDRSRFTCHAEIYFVYK